MTPLQELDARLEPLRQRLLHHPIYPRLDRLDAMHVFMQHHVFAVWDFMSLLKTLQQQLCCVTVPWRPVVDATNCRLINEIVLAEESDLGPDGAFISHFGLYRRAMQECRASTSTIDAFQNRLHSGRTVAEASAEAAVPAPAAAFIAQTFAWIETQETAVIASAFTFGRENLLPKIFQQIVDRLNDREEGRLETFRYYLDRHIGLDGDEHGPMATRLITAICGDDERRWKLVLDTAVRALETRLELWDGIARAIDRLDDDQ